MNRFKTDIRAYIPDIPDSGFEWRAVSENGSYPVTEFEGAPIFDG